MKKRIRWTYINCGCRRTSIRLANRRRFFYLVEIAGHWLLCIKISDHKIPLRSSSRQRSLLSNCWLRHDNPNPLVHDQRYNHAICKANEVLRTYTTTEMLTALRYTLSFLRERTASLETSLQGLRRILPMFQRYCTEEARNAHQRC